METLRKQVSRARRRLIVQAFSARLAWCWFVTLFVAAIAIGAGKWWPVFEPRIWALGCVATALGGGAIVAGVWTWARRQDALAAAVEIDRRFGLKERVSSTLALDPAERDTPIGQALVRDAEQRVAGVDVAGQFGLGLDRRALLPLVPAAVAFVLAMFVGGPASPPASEAAVAETAQIKKPAQALAKKLGEQRKEAAEKGLKEADLALVKQLEDAAKSVAAKTQVDRKQTLSALNDIVKTAEKRRQDLAQAGELKQQLQTLKNLQQGPAEKLGQALKNGDLQKAIKELDKLKEQLSGDVLEPRDKEALAKQLAQLQESLEKKVQANKQAREALKEQIASERRSGNTDAAEKLEKQLAKMTGQQPQQEQLDKMAQALKQAAESTSRGDAKQAADALSQLSDQLAGMQKESDELEFIESALEDVADAKSAMACKECDGEGCAACQGDGNKPNDKWGRRDMAKGRGMGAGRRGETKNETDFYDSQVKQNVGKGGSVVIGQAEGPNRKGRVQQEIQGQFSDAEQQTAEALSGQRLPHGYRDHAKKYFDSLREGQQK